MIQKIIYLVIISIFVSFAYANYEVIDLVKSLLRYEKGDAPESYCKPYMGSENYPVIGYGKVCNDSVKISNHNDAATYCKEFQDQCSLKQIEKWLDEDVKKVINQINNIEIYKKIFELASSKRKSVLISLGYQKNSEELKNIFDGLYDLIVSNKWEKVAEKIFKNKNILSNTNKFIRQAYIIESGDCNIDFCNRYNWNHDDSDSLSISSINNHDICSEFHNLYSNIKYLINDNYINDDDKNNDDSSGSRIITKNNLIYFVFVILTLKLIIL
ncbi:hypothetical protein LY90DRAFT_513522 [Neocallimastix californiae]|uniref:Lysozyme-like protein n=1 Tax=Neocallimastix californiae TaxID=1754190 RepID=A0A1Y2AY30_9FUNG|nr:hypothetical protein LY90DRAFT_513522 [Neocallimastix californiae]|eukprot:ORY27137.1 hypothetical protein LY90DRAFT_513522 [Neocallimastix californiae]